MASDDMYAETSMYVLYIRSRVHRGYAIVRPGNSLSMISHCTANKHNKNAYGDKVAAANLVRGDALVQVDDHELVARNKSIYPWLFDKHQNAASRRVPQYKHL